MTRFDRYVLAIFIKYILIVQLLIMIVTMFSSALAHLQSFSKFGMTLPQLVKLELITLPMGINSALPITMVVSSIVTVLLLMRSRELLAYASLGGRIQRFLVPFVVAAIFTSAFMLFFEYKVYNNIRYVQQRYISEDIKKQKYIGQRTLGNMWTVDRNKLVYIEFVDPIRGEMWNITEYTLNDDFQVDLIKTIVAAMPEGDKWKFLRVQTADISKVPPVLTYTDEEISDSALFTDLISVTARTPRQLSPTELSHAIGVLKKRGLGTVEYQMLLASKYANAFSVIVLVILVVPIGIDFSRRYSPVKSAAISFTFGVAFWAMLAALTSLGNTGLVPPLVANFMPHVVFLIVGIAILYWREKAR